MDSVQDALATDTKLNTGDGTRANLKKAHIFRHASSNTRIYNASILPAETRSKASKSPQILLPVMFPPAASVLYTCVPVAILNAQKTLNCCVG